MKIKEYDYGPIGARIKKARLDKKYTQEYAAEAIDVSCQHISDIERGINGITILLSLMSRKIKPVQITGIFLLKLHNNVL